MMPVYDQAGVTLYQGDCREVVPRLGPLFDVVVADPPYGETSLKWDRLVDGWLEVVKPKLNSAGSLSLRMFMATSDAFAAWRLVQDLVWEKHNGSSSAADRFKRVHEMVAHFVPGPARWADVHHFPVTTPDATARQVRRKHRPAHWGELDGHFYESVDGGPRLMRSVVRVRSCHGRAVHPTQKPEGIVEPLLRYSAPGGGIVLDPFAGSGTTLVVAKQLGLRAIGVELNRDYCERAIERLVSTLPLAGRAA